MTKGVSVPFCLLKCTVRSSWVFYHSFPVKKNETWDSARSGHYSVESPCLLEEKLGQPDSNSASPDPKH